MKILSCAVLVGSFVPAAFAADPQLIAQGKQQEQSACVQCHSLRLIHSQRLSAAAWGKEIDKMVGWGAPVINREALLAYLSEEYSDAKPVPQPEASTDGTTHAKN